MRSLLATLLALTATSLFAQVPDSLSYQGFLTRSDGTLVDSTGVSATFTLYKNGTTVWTETQVFAVENGMYDVYLGGVTPLDTVAFDQQIDLGVKLDGEESEMTPRTPLVSSPYALAIRGMSATAVRNSFGTRTYNVVGGFAGNQVLSGVVGGTICGGGGLQYNDGGPVNNEVRADFGTIGGGAWNLINVPNSADPDGALFGAILGGRANSVQGQYGAVVGGEANSAAEHGFVGGGLGNIVRSGYHAIVGGRSNSISGTASFGFIGGGLTNEISTGEYHVIGGGTENRIVHSQDFDGPDIGVISGGSENQAGGGIGATVPGGAKNHAHGDYSFAAGFRARANHSGSFVWQDQSGVAGDTLASTAPRQFLARASGGFFLYTGSAPDLTTGISLPAGSGTWTTLSSETSKTNLSEVNVQSYLGRVASLKLREWSYKTEQGVTHVGPMAEDFYAAFGHGPTDKGISGVDADGVALAAIQGLYELVKEQQAEIERMQEVMARAGLE